MPIGDADLDRDLLLPGDFDRDLRRVTLLRFTPVGDCDLCLPGDFDRDLLRLGDFRLFEVPAEVVPFLGDLDLDLRRVLVKHSILE